MKQTQRLTVKSLAHSNSAPLDTVLTPLTVTAVHASNRHRPVWHANTIPFVSHRITHLNELRQWRRPTQRPVTRPAHGWRKVSVLPWSSRRRQYQIRKWLRKVRRPGVSSSSSKRRLQQGYSNVRISFTSLLILKATYRVSTTYSWKCSYIIFYTTQSNV